MLAGIPFLTLLLLVLLFRTTQSDWRRAFLSATVLWGVMVTAITELLSLSHLLTTAGVAGIWVVTALSLAPVLKRLRRESIHPKKEASLLRLPRGYIVLIGSVVGIVSLTGLIAVMSPPNTWDAMTYHMSRVMHWIQNQSVEHFPTHTWRENYRTPWAEFVILHLQLLSRDDRFANLVQWFSMVGSLVAVTLIAAQLGADLRGQILAAVVSVTLPSGILQATSTQTDYVGTFWLLCCVSYILTLIDSPDGAHWSVAVMLGASLGLALLTKPSNYFYTLPFLTWLIVSLGKASGARVGVIVAVIAVLTLSINAGHYSRNLSVYGNPIGPNVEEMCSQCKLTNDVWTMPVLLSNVIRHAAPHFGTPWELLNKILEEIIEHIHRWLALSTSDTRTTHLGFLFKIQPPLYVEDYDGNPLHFLLIIGASMLLFFARRRMPRTVVIYSLAIAAGFLLLCLIVKWNPFTSRTQLPLFVLWCPLIGFLLSRFQFDWMPCALAALLVACSVPWLLFNARHPIITVETPIPKHLAHLGYAASLNPSILRSPRSSLYFYAHHELESGFLKVAGMLKERDCHQIGLVKGWDDWEYPLWPLLQAGTTEQIRIEHIDAPNQSGEIIQAVFTPCAYVKFNRLEIEVVLLPSG